MRELGIIVLIAISVFGVALLTQSYRDETADERGKEGYGFNVVVVDSCEYIICESGYKGFMAHKGNCKFCEQRAKNKN